MIIAYKIVKFNIRLSKEVKSMQYNILGCGLHCMVELPASALAPSATRRTVVIFFENNLVINIRPL